MPDNHQEPFVAPFAKIARAEKHIKELEQMTDDFFRSEPAKISFSPAPPPGMTTGFTFNLSIKGAPIEMSLVIGDVVHNLRSALDLLASDLCRLNGQSPDDVYFPFCAEESFLESMISRKHFDRAGDDAVKLLKDFKPYKGGNAALRALHDLDIQDKHQMLIPSTLWVASPILEIHDGKGNAHVDESGNFKPKVVGDPNKPSDQKLVFPDSSVLAGKELVPTLHDLVRNTAGIIEAFKALRNPTG